MTIEEGTYQMTLSLNVLKHLGLGLYSNVAAVLSEVVANAWDADAEHVSISIDSDAGRVTIQDDGHGMSIDDANHKYLHVGYERRNEGEAFTPIFERPVMGRKGIGKLSLFSIARTVEVHSVGDNGKHGFTMDSDAIEKKIKDRGEAQYNPIPVDPEEIDIDCGTRIVLTNMKRRLQWTGTPLRRRLARRFSVIGELNDFEVELDGQPITIDDRDYQDKLQYIWTFGDIGSQNRIAAKKLENAEERSGNIDEDSGWTIDGWIGTALTAGHLKDSDTSESINKIVIMVRGKLAQEDILEEFGEGGLYTKYILGEIHADFLDLNNREDIATTSRQRLIEEDPRYQALKGKLRSELRHIEDRWTDLRNQQGAEQALLFPQIQSWFGDLNPDHKKAAERLFGRINQLPIDDEDQRRQLFVSGILAFESLRLRNLLHKLDEVSTENLGILREIFLQLDDLEASAYYRIIKGRLEVIRRLTGLVDTDAKEKAIQEHLYNHLWLLDASWERATRTEHMERRIYTALEVAYDTLTEEEKRSRLDIYYRTNANKHVIIELKRANRVLKYSELIEQVTKYYDATERALDATSRSGEPIEIVCVIGDKLQEWDSSSREQRDRSSLDAHHARIVTYDELIDNALRAYQDYVDSIQEPGRVYRLIKELDEQDFKAISPETPLDSA